jgi:hypothetical protein
LSAAVPLPLETGTPVLALAGPVCEKADRGPMRSYRLFSFAEHAIILAPTEKAIIGPETKNEP